MNARELIEKWENDVRLIRTHYGPHDKEANEWADGVEKCIRELRAALPEQPLAKQWRKEADGADESAHFHPDPNIVRHLEGWAESRRECADDLDSQRDRDRELLRRAETILDDAADTMPHAEELLDEIRKHLEGESDEA